MAASCRGRSRGRGFFAALEAFVRAGLSGAGNEPSSEAPWPESGGQADQQARTTIGSKQGSVERQRNHRLDPQTIPPGSAKTAADRRQLLAADRKDDVLVPYPGLIGEQEGLDRPFARTARESRTEAKLGGGRKAAVAKDGARVIAAADRVVAGGEFLETEQRVGAILSAGRGGDGETRIGPDLAFEPAS